MNKAAMTNDSSKQPANARILTINGGSSSIKFALFEAGESIRRILQGLISAAASRVAVRVIHTDEEQTIVRSACRVLRLTMANDKKTPSMRRNTSRGWTRFRRMEHCQEMKVQKSRLSTKMHRSTISTPTKLETPKTARPAHIPACLGGGWGGSLRPPC